MKFGVFFEIQTPKPWTFENEYNTLWTEIRHVELAEKLGFSYAWSCEHHSLGVRAHCSAPEVYLAAISQRTSTIRLGHAIIEMIPPINHVVRVAERLATLDLLSNGRVDAGLGRTRVAEDLRVFNVDPAQVHDMWLEGVQALPRIWTEDPFSFQGKYYSIPPCSIVPKPYQKPHPPIWIAITSPESFPEAGHLGLGVLTPASSVSDEKITAYREAAKNPTPVGKMITNQLGVMIHVYCDKDDKAAIERGDAGEEWLLRSFEGLHGSTGYKRPAGTTKERVGKGTVAFGDPQRLIDTLKMWEAKGVDQILCWFRYGMLPDDEVQKGFRLFAEKVMPHFA